MENDNKSTQKRIINFEIDVPTNFEESVFNSIILGLLEYEARKYDEWKTDLDVKVKIQNDLLMRIQSEIEQLIIKEVE